MLLARNPKSTSIFLRKKRADVKLDVLDVGKVKGKEEFFIKILTTFAHCVVLFKVSLAAFSFPFYGL